MPSSEEQPHRSLLRRQKTLHLSTVCPSAVLAGTGDRGHLCRLDAGRSAAVSGLQDPVVRGEVARDARPMPPGPSTRRALLRIKGVSVFRSWFSALTCADPGKSCAAAVPSSPHDAAAVVPQLLKLGQWPAGGMAVQGATITSACWTATGG